MTSSGGGTDEFQEKEDPFQTHCSLSAHVCCFATIRSCSTGNW